MQKMPEPVENHLLLSECGIDIPSCHLDVYQISIRCDDLSRYRKALRVKIRALLKTKEYDLLQGYIDMLYRLALFSQYIYGYHSCTTPVSLWQEQLAIQLQKMCDNSLLGTYAGDTWLQYDTQVLQSDIFDKAQVHHIEMDEAFIQDHKPFLNPKDKSHFDKAKEYHA
jgi:hypothetical protein